MIEKLKKLFERYRELILYVFFGGVTTVVNFVVYGLCTDVLQIYYLAANAIAWILAVAVAYITNRIWVFHSKKSGFNAIAREIALFVGARIFSGLGDMLIMFICVDLLHIPGLVAKILANVFVVILNYILSKLIIFKNK